MQRLNLFNELKSVSAGRLFQGATTRSVKMNKDVSTLCLKKDATVIFAITLANVDRF